MMIIKTNTPIFNNREIITTRITDYWDKLSKGWQLIWGQHIHHGFYDQNTSISPQEAQEILIIKLAELLKIKPSYSILDVGCGLGGSSIYLAKHFNVNVTGITLSTQQVAIAKQQAGKEQINHVQFTINDALSLANIANNSIDIVWSLESCEQFYDKNLFIQQAFRVLKPGGQLIIATWCSDQEQYQDTLAKKYLRLCNAFDLPYMPTISHYQQLLALNNFNINDVYDWSSQVKKSWEIGISLINHYSLLQIIKVSGFKGLKFVKQLKLMKEAFNQGSVKYGVFVATKPLSL